MQNFLKRELKFSSLLILFTILIYSIHWYIDYSFYPTHTYNISILIIYLFHFITVFIVFSVINYFYSKGKKQYFTLFLGSTLVKMVLCIIFLLPIILKPSSHPKHEALNFFIPYFIFLAFEIFSIMNFLKQK